MQESEDIFKQYGFESKEKFVEFIERKLNYLTLEGVVSINEEGKFYQKTAEELNKEVEDIAS